MAARYVESVYCVDVVFTRCTEKSLCCMTTEVNVYGGSHKMLSIPVHGVFWKTGSTPSRSSFLISISSKAVSCPHRCWFRFTADELTVSMCNSSVVSQLFLTVLQIS